MHFQPTRWSLVARAGGGSTTSSRAAIGELFELYRYPLYAFGRRAGIDHERAADLVQGFFLRLLNNSLVERADPSKGKFRSYLLAAFKRHLNNERDREHARKRGGEATHVEFEDAERRYGLEPADGQTPQRVYERTCAVAILTRVFEHLESEAIAVGKARQFAVLKELIPGPLPDRSYADVARDLGTSQGAVRVAIHRLRERYRQVLVELVAETVETVQDVDDEIRALHAAVARP